MSESARDGRARPSCLDGQRILARRLIRAAALAWALALSVVPPPSTAQPAGQVGIGQSLADAELLGLNGKSRMLSSFRGRPLIINVWASWCGPCRAETASLERLAWNPVAKHLSIIGISTDDDPQAALAWLKASNATLSHFIDRHLKMESMLGADRLPLTVLVDARGRVVDKIYGARAWDAAESVRLIERAFGPAEGAPLR